MARRASPSAFFSAPQPLAVKGGIRAQSPSARLRKTWGGQALDRGAERLSDRRPSATRSEVWRAGTGSVDPSFGDGWSSRVQGSRPEPYEVATG